MRVITIALSLGLLPLIIFGQQPAATATTTAESTNPSISIAQQAVLATSSYHRVLAIVPVTGSGTHDDPVRPMFAPAPSAVPAPRTGITAYQHQLSDDGTLAIVEFVSPTRAAFAQLFASTDPRVQVFEVGFHSQAEILAAFQRVKASFSFANFRPLAVR